MITVRLCHSVPADSVARIKRVLKLSQLHDADMQGQSVRVVRDEQTSVDAGRWDGYKAMRLFNSVSSLATGEAIQPPPGREYTIFGATVEVTRPGRRPLAEGDGKTARVQLKLTPADKAAWLAKSAAAGLTLQAWVEQRCK